MATVQDRQKPNAGTKVDLGKDAPVRQEGTGLVQPESLAAQSKQAEGAFAENREGQTASFSTSSGAVHQQQSQEGKEGDDNEARMSRLQRKLAFDRAKWATRAEQMRKNKEEKDGGDDEKGGNEAAGRDGLKAAMEAEPESESDPSRLAEKEMLQRNAQGGAGVSRQGEVDGQSGFDGLEREVSA